MKSIGILFSLVFILSLGACSQSQIPGENAAFSTDDFSEVGSTLNPVAETGEPSDADTPEFSGQNHPSQNEGTTDGDADADPEITGETPINIVTGIHFQRVPQTELEYRLAEYGESVGMNNLQLLLNEWESCAANFNPSQHQTSLDNGLFCFFRNTDESLAEDFVKIDEWAGQAEALYQLLVTSHPGAQNAEAFADTLNDRLNLVTGKLHQIVNQLSVARLKIRDHAEIFDIHLEIINLGDWEASDSYNWVIKEYLQNWLFSSTWMEVQKIYTDHNIENHLTFELYQLRETFTLLHLAGSFLTGPAGDTNNFLSFIQFDPGSNPGATYFDGENCQGTLTSLMGVVDFSYMIQ